MLQANSVNMSVAAKAGEMQIFSCEAIEKHLKQKPHFNFACPSSPATQLLGGADPTKMAKNMRNGIPTNKNIAQLLPKLNSKSADPNITEFMTRLVSPPSRDPMVSQFKSSYNTQNKGEISFESTL